MDPTLDRHIQDEAAQGSVCKSFDTTILRSCVLSLMKPNALFAFFATLSMRSVKRRSFEIPMPRYVVETACSAVPCLFYLLTAYYRVKIYVIW